MNRALIDSKGNVFRDCIKKDLKVEQTKRKEGFVRLMMRHDSLKFARGSPVLLEKRYLSHEGPNTKQVSMIVDVLKAVRLVKHIREGYDLEKEKLEMLFSHISNSIMLLERHSKKSKQCEEDLALAKTLVGSTICMMGGVRSFYKVISKIKLEKAANYVQNALKADNDFEMNMHLKPAVSILYAAKRRLTVRLDSIGKIQNYNLQREMLVRGIRDYYIHNKLVYLNQWLSSSPTSAMDAYLLDMSIYNRVLRLLERCEKEQLKESSGFLKFKEDIEALGTSIKYIKGKENAVELLREAYVLGIKKMMFREACTKLDKVLVYTGINKPFYIAAQLEETGDEYTPPIVAHLREVDECMLSRNHKAALQSIQRVIGFYEVLFSESKCQG